MASSPIAFVCLVDPTHPSRRTDLAYCGWQVILFNGPASFVFWKISGRKKKRTAGSVIQYIVRLVPPSGHGFDQAFHISMVFTPDCPFPLCLGRLDGMAAIGFC